jgi:hypothetical protein
MVGGIGVSVGVAVAVAVAVGGTGVFVGVGDAAVLVRAALCSGDGPQATSNATPIKITKAIQKRIICFIFIIDILFASSGLLINSLGREHSPGSHPGLSRQLLGGSDHELI